MTGAFRERMSVRYSLYLPVLVVLCLWFKSVLCDLMLWNGQAWLSDQNLLCRFKERHFIRPAFNATSSRHDFQAFTESTISKPIQIAQAHTFRTTLSSLLNLAKRFSQCRRYLFILFPWATGRLINDPAVLSSITLTNKKYIVWAVTLCWPD